MEKDKVKITHNDLAAYYEELYGEKPSWTDKKFIKMDKEERNEYKNTRKKLERKNNPEDPYIQQVKKQVIDEPQELEMSTWEDENRLTEDELWSPIIHTTQKVIKDLPTTEEEERLDKVKEEDKLIQKYFKHHKIDSQERLNYIIEHDVKFKTYLEKIGRLDSMYTGKHLGTIEKEKKDIEKEFESFKKKKKQTKKKPKETFSNEFEESKKKLDIERFRNKKLEKQGYILSIYLRKNGTADARYVKMDEVGQIKVDGYVYHERDAIYRIGKKNDPVLVIMEGALVPITKDSLKENLGFMTAEAQKLMIRGIEQAEVVKAGSLEDKLKGKTPPKWMIIVGIAIIVGIYAFMGGFS